MRWFKPASSQPQRARASVRRSYLEFAFAFVCVFAGLSLPGRGVGPYYARVHAALGSALVEGREFDSGVKLRFEAEPAELAEHPWQATLVIQPPAPRQEVRMPIELRSLLFLPLAAFIALGAAVPLGSARRNLRLLLIGAPLLELVLLLLTALPIVSFLGGTGPIEVFTLSAPVHALLQIPYRALVAPPGMAYAVPLLLWWVLVVRLRPEKPSSVAGPVPLM